LSSSQGWAKVHSFLVTFDFHFTVGGKRHIYPVTFTFHFVAMMELGERDVTLVLSLLGVYFVYFEMRHFSLLLLPF
jgi:hypothetical protein